MEKILKSFGEIIKKNLVGKVKKKFGNSVNKI